MPTPRDQAHAEQRRRILATARAHLIRDGAAQLSLRKVIAEVGMVSSALYRYFPNRESLLTALIIETYAELADELAAVAAGDPRQRFADLARRLIAWGRANPHLFALIYGSPVSGYAAPADTIEPAGRVVVPFLVAAAEGEQAGQLTAPELADPDLAGQAAVLVHAGGVDLGPAAAVAVVEAVTLLIGAVTLDLGGHYVGTFDPFDLLAERLVGTATVIAGFSPWNPLAARVPSS